MGNSANGTKAAAKQRYITNDGNPYTLNPYEQIWDGDYYYVRRFCNERGQMRSFRLDRIDGAPVRREDQD